MPIDLPASLDRNVQTLDREVMDARAMTPEERLRCVALACRAAIDLLAFNVHRERILATQDPLPASSVQLLARLRERERVAAKMRVRA